MIPTATILRRLAGVACLSLTLMLAACPQSPGQKSAADSPVAQQPTASAADDSDNTAARDSGLGESAALPQGSKPGPPKVRTGGPLPPQVMPEPAKLDRSCRTEADCTVKDVGSCCGAYPACVNRNSPTDPAAVQAECAKRGQSSTCGFREISACQCVQGSCLAGVRAIEPSIDPAPQPLEER